MSGSGIAIAIVIAFAALRQVMIEIELRSLRVRIEGLVAATETHDARLNLHASEIPRFNNFERVREIVESNRALIRWAFIYNPESQQQNQEPS